MKNFILILLSFLIIGCGGGGGGSSDGTVNAKAIDSNRVNVFISMGQSN